MNNCSQVPPPPPPMKKEKRGFFFTLKSRSREAAKSFVSLETEDQDSVETCKQRKPVERRESTRLQSAAKLLRNLSKSKDVTSSTCRNDESSSSNVISRSQPFYRSEGKGVKKRRSVNVNGVDVEVSSHTRSQSFHGNLATSGSKIARAVLRCEMSKNKSASSENRAKSCYDLLGVDSCASSVHETIRVEAKSILLTEDNLKSPNIFPPSSNSVSISVDKQLTSKNDVCETTAMREQVECTDVGSQKVNEVNSFSSLPRADSCDSIYELAESLVADVTSNSDQSSPEKLDRNIMMQSTTTITTAPPHKLYLPGPFNYSGAKSLSYISRSLSSEQQRKISRTCELEEYARRYEALQRGSTRRRLGVNSVANGINNNSITEKHLNNNGRDSVMTDSSSETVKFQDLEIYQNVPRQHNYVNSSSSSMVLTKESPRLVVNQHQREYQDYQNISFPKKHDYFQPIRKDSRKYFKQNKHGADPALDAHEDISKSVPNLAVQNPLALNHDAEKCLNFSYLDPDKRMKVSDNTLRLIQRQALLEYYERYFGTIKRNSASTIRSCTRSDLDGPPPHDSGFYSPTAERHSSNDEYIRKGLLSMSQSNLPLFNNKTTYFNKSGGHKIHEDEEYIMEDDVFIGNSSKDFTMEEHMKSQTLSRNITPEADSSARPVYLQERFLRKSSAPSQLSSSKRLEPELEAWQTRQEAERERLRYLEHRPLPPERPPKKPYLREVSASSPSSTSTNLTQTSAANLSLDENTSTLQIIQNGKVGSSPGRPKFPSPPGSPLRSRRQDDLVYSLQDSSEMAKEEQDNTFMTTSTLRIRDTNNTEWVSSTAESNQTLSPSTSFSQTRYSTANDSATEKATIESNNRRISAARAQIPKRESPATIAAKEAPGWEKFLGGKTSTVQFTSEELRKLKHRSEDVSGRRRHSNCQSSGLAPPIPLPKPHFDVSLLLPIQDDTTSSVQSTNQTKCRAQENIGMSPIHSSKSSPSLYRLTATASPNPTPKSPWKNSLDSLQNNNENPVRRGYTSRDITDGTWSSKAKEDENYNGRHHVSPAGNIIRSSNSQMPIVANHCHSNSDSGLSSLSGRTSTMSPISTMSTVSSVSSNSSSGSSSRASLRSASIVSSSTIPLDEEEDVLSSARSQLSVTVRSPSTSIVTATRTFMPTVKSCFTFSEKLPEERECEELLTQLMALSPSNRSTHVKLSCLLGVFISVSMSAKYLENIFDFGQSKDSISSINSQHNCDKETSEISIKRSFEMDHLNKNGTLVPEVSDNCFKEEPSLMFLEKKKELCASISNMLDVLRGLQTTLKESIKLNEEAGRDITRIVMQLAQPSECDKYKLHVTETDKITSLILGLAGRLSRSENCLHLVADDANEQEQANLKRKRLLEQLEDAKKLKVNIDKRSICVDDILNKYLTKVQFSKYEQFMKTKCKLIIDSRYLTEKINMAETHLKELDETSS